MIDRDTLTTLMQLFLTRNRITCMRGDGSLCSHVLPMVGWCDACVNDAVICKLREAIARESERT